MATVRGSGVIFADVNTNLADNNAGNISAADLRVPLEDLIVSMVGIVGSGDMDVKYPFYNDVRLRKVASAGGTIILESGAIFPNAPNNAASRQVEPFLGVNNIQHNNLAGLTTGDPHKYHHL